MKISRYIHIIIKSIPARMTLTAVLAMTCLASCIEEDEFDNSPRGNFEALWKIIDEHYCFFEYKHQEYGLDWNEVYNKYKVRVDNGMTSDQLFEVMTDMLAELRDGHVNLSRSADFARYWKWHENYPANFSDTLQRIYLGTDYKIAAGIKYKILDDNIGYVYYGSFSDGIGEGNINEVLNRLMLCRGIIIDIRNNSGGMLTYAERLAARFAQKPTHVGYICHKTGKGHDSFSSPKEQWLNPSSNIRWHKNVCVLTNRHVYSAANEFVKYMKCFDNVTVVGDNTGGGAGMPFNSSLPNGWAVRFSACPMYDNKGRSTEFGIEPHHKADITDSDFKKGKDTIIEHARKLLREKADNQPPDNVKFCTAIQNL